MKDKKSANWVHFFFESNQFFDTIKDEKDWQRLRDAYPNLTDDELLNAKEATYEGSLSKDIRDKRPNYGFRIEHDGERTLRDFFKSNKMTLAVE